jgi:hypothetical protein
MIRVQGVCRSGLQAAAFAKTTTRQGRPGAEEKDVFNYLQSGYLLSLEPLRPFSQPVESQMIYAPEVFNTGL